MMPIEFGKALKTLAIIVAVAALLVGWFLRGCLR